MGVLQHHDAITGTEKQVVADDYTITLSEQMGKSNKVYSKLLAQKLEAMTGIKANTIGTCTQPQNDTVMDCPQANEALDSFILVAHNQKAVSHSQFLRIQLPKSNYKAELWCKKTQTFTDGTHFDIFE